MIGKVLLGLALAAAALPLPAAAETRGYSVTSFDRIQVNGPFVVRLTTGRGVSARAEGDYRAINEISVDVVGSTLRVRRNVSSDWGGYPGEGNSATAVLYLTTHRLEQATVIGTGDLEIDRMEGQRLIASLGGNGRLAVGEFEADDLSLAVTGAGILEAGGAAATGQITVEGPGTVIAGGLAYDDVRITLSGPGSIEVRANREADVTAVGNGMVIVRGDASCIDRSVGSNRVDCSGFLNRR